MCGHVVFLSLSCSNCCHCQYLAVIVVVLLSLPCYFHNYFTHLVSEVCGHVVFVSLSYRYFHSYFVCEVCGHVVLLSLCSRNSFVILLSLPCYFHTYFTLISLTWLVRCATMFNDVVFLLLFSLLFHSPGW